MGRGSRTAALTRQEGRRDVTSYYSVSGGRCCDEVRRQTYLRRNALILIALSCNGDRLAFIEGWFV